MTSAPRALDAPLANQPTTLARWERRTAWPLTGLAILSLVTYVLSAALDVTAPWLTWLDWATWAAFAVDYVTRLSLTPAGRRWAWVRGHVFDLAAVALPALRSLRALAVLARLVVSAQRGVAERILVTTVGAAVLLGVVGAAAALNAERGAAGANITTYGDALWWATTTLTTVGYGDRYPVTSEGRVIAGVLMIAGIGALASVIGTLTSFVTSYVAKHKE